MARAVDRFRYNNELNPYGTPTPTMPAMPTPGAGLFDDPYTAGLESAATARIAQLSQPFSDPSLDEVVSLIKGRIGGLSSPVSIGASANPYAADFSTQARQRIAELNQEPFSAPEEERLRTRAVGNVEQLRSAAKQRATEDAARRGLGESSGIIQEQYRNVDRSFDADRTRAESDLAMYITNERNSRRNQAAQLAQALAGFGEQAAGRADSLAVASANLNNQRESQLMGLISALADISAQKRGEARANANDVMAITQMLANLGPQRLALAMNVLNGTGGNDLSGLFNNQLNLSNTQTQQSQYASAQRQAFMLGLGKIMAELYGQGQG